MCAGTLAVSVVIPVYNNATGVQRAVRAVLTQNLPTVRYEIVVVDNASTDRTRKVLEELAAASPQLIRVAEEQSVQSSYAARNRGIQVARGDVIAFTDSDCIPRPSWLTEGLQGLQSTGAAFAAGRVEMSYRGDEPSVWEYLDAARKLDQEYYTQEAGFGATANLFVRRSMFREHGRFRRHLRSGGDYEFGRRLTSRGEELVFLPDAVVVHPARRSLRALLKKAARIGEGQATLQRMGKLEHSRLNWRSFAPRRRHPELESHGLPWHRKLLGLVGLNLLHYWNLVVRLYRLVRPLEVHR